MLRPQSLHAALKFSMANKINHLIDIYRRLNEQSANVVLATIVETFGKK